MIRCIVIDDEPWACALLEDYVRKIPFLELVESSSNPIDAIHKIQNGDIELAFLDIQMPELTGIQLMKIIQNKCRVILTTAYSDYALESYDYNVIDYLLKPISFERFFIAATKAKDILTDNLETKTASSELPRTNIHLNEFIFVKTDKKTVKLDFSDIIYIESLRDYIAFHTTKEKLLVLDSLKAVEATLPQQIFIRVHKSFIVSINAIGSIERNRIFLRDQTIIPIGETYRDNFMRLLNVG
ncbi:response regulator transcription factor [Rhizosphaericola mali]|uniref:Response regulator transcription factor n=2 Tax=Rhizosphaericola mali TaxID=2545455 RepID=A0A5P2GB41_9BACT|nr:response regulator transcription factor [Rhizosphaericola mali]